MKDKLYRSDQPVSPFEFNKKVVDVFPDMIERSVPGYPLTISMISVLADEYAQEGSNIYDLGCSVGAASFAIQQTINKQCNIIAVDSSQAMIEQCLTLAADENTTNVSIDFIQENIQHTEIVNASVVVMNFTLQFIPLAERKELLKNIYNGLLPGGIFILSEKITFEDKEEEQVMNNLHLHMKSLNDYNQLEIANKRKALEEVLIPETIASHQRRLEETGFKQSFVWLKCFNFISLFSVK